MIHKVFFVSFIWIVLTLFGVSTLGWVPIVLPIKLGWTFFYGLLSLINFLLWAWTIDCLFKFQLDQQNAVPLMIATFMKFIVIGGLIFGLFHEHMGAVDSKIFGTSALLGIPIGVAICHQIEVRRKGRP